MINKIKKKFSSVFKFAGDMLYTTGSTVVMQIVLQIILYPILNRFFGQSTTGTILYFMGIIYIFPQAVGISLCNTRLISRKTMNTTNGDYSKLLLYSSIICSFICFGFAFADEFDLVFSILFAIFSVIYAVRMYTTVAYRLSLNFKGYFISNALISLGYLAGLGLYFIVHNWLIIFVVGELIGLFYAFKKTDIFKKQKPTGNIKQNLKNNIMLIFSTLLRDGVNQYDKVVIFMIISSEVVTQYNALTLIGKSVQMLINPINTLIITYLSAKTAKLTLNYFKKFAFISVGSGLVLLLCCQIATPIYIKLFYSTFFDSIMSFCFLVNLGLIIGFVASLYLATIMSQGKTVTYTVIQIAWGVIYTVFAYIFTKLYGITGLAYVSIVINSLKFIAGIILMRKLCTNGSDNQKEVSLASE